MVISLAFLITAISASMVIFDETTAQEEELKSTTVKIPLTEPVAEIFGGSSLQFKIDTLQSDVQLQADSKDNLHERVKAIRDERWKSEDRLYARFVRLRGSDWRLRYFFPKMADLRSLEERLDQIDKSLGF
jgi:hypothetical protein